MKIPLSWLQEVIDLNLTADTIAAYLTKAGLEVDKVEKIVPNYQGVVVAEVLDTKPHPNAEKLCIATVTDGIETLQIVCGASNCRPGLKTALAKIGATLPDGSGGTFKIKPAKLRGVESYGMLCSEAELQLTETLPGIIEFASQVKVGADVAQMYSETIFEISLTPNLGHCASILGVARELSAITGSPIHLPLPKVEESSQDLTKDHVKLDVVDTQRCLRYCCRLIRGVTVGSSPDWLKRRLEASGMRPINNIVDITNYVMLLRGHPLHAFDFHHIDGGHLIIRGGHDWEQFVTLDGKNHHLTTKDLMICDVGQSLCIAGIMGGQYSEVTDRTRDVLLEAAYFDPIAIRRSSKRLGIQTEASRRFERGCDPNALQVVLDEAAALINEIAGGIICSGIMEWSKQSFPSKKVTCRLSRINSLLGIHLSLNEVEDLFHRMHLPYTWDGEDLFTIQAPTYRHDLNLEVDIIEEVARLYGYEHFSAKESHPARLSSIPHTPIFLFERIVRSRLVGSGLQEVLNCDLIGPSILDLIQVPLMEESQIKVLNPASIEQSVLRTSLLPGMLQVAKHNENHQVRELQIFEIGRIHFKEEEKFCERTMAGILLTGEEAASNWSHESRPIDFYYLKGVVESLLAELGLPPAVFESHNWAVFHPGRQAQIRIGDAVVGVLGEIHPAIIRRLDFPQRIYFAEINLDDLMLLKQPAAKMKPLPLYPASERDWTVTVDESVSYQDLYSLCEKIAAPIIESISLVAIYRGAQVPKGKKNVTLRFLYRDPSKTLSQETIDKEQAHLVSEVSNQLNLMTSETQSSTAS